MEINEKVTDEEQLNKHLSNIGSIIFKKDELQFKIFFIKDFGKNGNESCLVFMLNHALVDGVGGILLACQI